MWAATESVAQELLASVLQHHADSFSEMLSEIQEN